MQALLCLSRLIRLRITLGARGRVSTGNGLQPSLEPVLIPCRADMPSRLYEALALAPRLLWLRCLCYDSDSPSSRLPCVL